MRTNLQMMEPCLVRRAALRRKQSQVRLLNKNRLQLKLSRRPMHSRKMNQRNQRTTLLPEWEAMIRRLRQRPMIQPKRTLQSMKNRFLNRSSRIPASMLRNQMTRKNKILHPRSLRKLMKQQIRRIQWMIRRLQRALMSRILHLRQKTLLQVRNNQSRMQKIQATMRQPLLMSFRQSKTQSLIHQRQMRAKVKKLLLPTSSNQVSSRLRRLRSRTPSQRMRLPRIPNLSLKKTHRKVILTWKILQKRISLRPLRQLQKVCNKINRLRTHQSKILQMRRSNKRQ